jgi:hypothetical protein
MRREDVVTCRLTLRTRMRRHKLRDASVEIVVGEHGQIDA